MGFFEVVIGLMAAQSLVLILFGERPPPGPPMTSKDYEHVVASGMGILAFLHAFEVVTMVPYFLGFHGDDVARRGVSIAAIVVTGLLFSLHGVSIVGASLGRNKKVMATLIYSAPVIMGTLIMVCIPLWDNSDAPSSNPVVVHAFLIGMALQAIAAIILFRGAVDYMVDKWVDLRAAPTPAPVTARRDD